jgi:hypothetical protein
MVGVTSLMFRAKNAGHDLRLTSQLPRIQGSRLEICDSVVQNICMIRDPARIELRAKDSGLRRRSASVW